MIKLKTLALFIIVFAIALVFRLWKISEIPKSLSMDEVAVGWNAYSILKTGKDEFGASFPLFFKSVGDYKTPVAIYLVAPSIAVFGLNEFAVRFPAVLFGAATAVVFILLLRELGVGKTGSVMGGIFFAINPWHVYLSRTSFDGVIALFFLISGTYLFLNSIKSKSVVLISLALGLMSISVWSYHSQRVFVPLLFVFLVIYFKKELLVMFKQRKNIIFPTAILLLFVIPFVYTLVSGQGITSRAADLWVGKDSGTTWAKQYLNYFDLNLWFFKGLNLTLPGYPDVGFLYFFDLPIFVLGACVLIWSKNKLAKAACLFWFLSGPFAGSLTRGGINPGRILIWLPFFGIVMSSSCEYLWEKFKNGKIIMAIYSIFIIWNIAYFGDMLIFNFPKYYADLWHYGYKEAAQYICENHNKYDKVIITDKYGIEWPSVKTIPYLYFLFYCKWDPNTYLKDTSIFNVEIRQPQWRIDSKENNYLLVGSRWDFPENFDQQKIFKRISFPSGKDAFYFVETDKNR